MNTQVKHTPGPWKVRTAYSNGEPVCYTIHLGQTSIADVTSLSEQDRVNAALIAAAPAMYEALLGCLKVARAHLWDVCSRWDDHEGYIPKGIAEVDAARMEVDRLEKIIAQAEGK